MRIQQVSVQPQVQVQGFNTEQLSSFVGAALQNGSELVKDEKSKSYYLRLPVEFSANEGETLVKVDADLAKAILDALSTGGRISRPEALGPIMEKIADGGRYGDGEAVLTRLLLAACDDRKKVKLNGDRINLTDAAEKAFQHKIASFWGTLGAQARWGDIQPQVDQGPKMQSGSGYGQQDGIG
jgi:hypothetical protein